MESDGDGIPGSHSTGDADSVGAWVRNWCRSIVCVALGGARQWASSGAGVACEAHAWRGRGSGAGEGSLVHAHVVRGQGSAEVSRYLRQAALDPPDSGAVVRWRGCL